MSKGGRKSSTIICLQIVLKQWSDFSIINFCLLFYFADEARQNGANILVHCHAGVSRSATITIAYLLKHTKLSMMDIYRLVKGKRSIISPNFNFMGQLMEYEQALNNGLCERTVIPSIIPEESSVWRHTSTSGKDCGFSKNLESLESERKRFNWPSTFICAIKKKLKTWAKHKNNTLEANLRNIPTIDSLCHCPAHQQHHQEIQNSLWPETRGKWGGGEYFVQCFSRCR